MSKSIFLKSDFYPRPPRGGRRQPNYFFNSAYKFLSTPSARRATPTDTITALWLFYFYPRPPRGGRPALGALEGVYGHFYPRPPRGGRPIQQQLMRASHTNFYPRPPRGGRQGGSTTTSESGVFLSTPSARRATCDKILIESELVISIHALREEGDMGLIPPFCTMSHFYPRPPRGGRPGFGWFCCRCLPISIHALREEGDIQLTNGKRAAIPISIHALREEGDPPQFPLFLPFCDFYPRPPRGGRLKKSEKEEAAEKFLSTPSARRATPSTSVRRT